jgi:hypothetical protein
VSTPTHYEWLPEGQTAPVRLSFEALDYISQAVSQGFAAVPKRGAEVGGILLGQFEPSGKPVIEAAESVACSYAYGPAYELTTEDFNRFRDTVALLRERDGVKPVGMFRSVTGTSFAPAEADITLFNQFFPEAGAVLLVVKPDSTRVSRGGFFVRKGKKLPASTPLEFPFSRKLLGGGSRRRRDAAPEQPAAAEALAPEAVAAPSEMEPAAPALAPRLVRSGIAFTLASVTLAAALGLGGGYFLGRTVPFIADPGRYAVGLRVEDRVTELAVRWETRAEALRTATGAKLRVRDGDGGTSEVPLDLEQLRAGRAVFAGNGSGGLEFEIEISQLAGTTILERTSFTPRPGEN